jgi:hypothetical protein
MQRHRVINLQAAQRELMCSARIESFQPSCVKGMEIGINSPSRYSLAPPFKRQTSCIN